MEVSISLLRIPISVMNPSRRLFPDQLYGRGERWGEGGILSIFHDSWHQRVKSTMGLFPLL